MLTYPANYESALNSPFKENWLFQLHSDDTGNNFIPLSFNDTTVGSVFYYGAVLNKPGIRESIDLKSSKAKTTNLSISIPNFNYNGSDISTYMLNTGGSTHYVNRPVKIYSQLNDASSLSDCLQVFNGRLRYISFTGDKLQLQIVSERPWDNIDIPNIFSTNNVPVPVAYGNYNNNKVTGLTTLKTVYPAPLSGSQENKFYYHTPKSYTSASLVNYYDNANDLFPFLTHDFATVTFEGKDAIGISNAITRTYRIRATAINDSNQWTNAGNAFDTDNTTFASANAQGDTDTPVVTTKSLYLNMPNITGKITFARFYIKADVTYTESDSTVGGTVAIRDDSFGNNNIIISKTDSNGTVSTSGNADPDGTGTAYGFRDWTSDVASNNNQLPNAIKINLTSTPTQDDNSHTLDADGKVYDIYLQITSENDYTNEPIASTKDLPEYVYIGGDGLEKSWSSGTITKIHDAHRDIIHRFTGWGVSGGSYTTPENWSSGLNIDSERTDWNIRHWVSEPKPLKTVLEKLQYEGGFIARFRANASLQYIVIPASPSASVTLTSSDISKLDVAHVPFEEIQTKMNIQWNKHPAKNLYLNSATYTNGGNNTKRTRLNITNDKENVKEVKLNAFADNTSAQRFFNYYDGLLGDLFIKISGEIVNPAYYKLEVGDLIAIDNSFPYAPFGEAWSGKIFMITSTNRAAHTMRFAARQIN